MSWKLKTLDELGNVGRGRSRHRPRDAEHLYGGAYPFIQTGDVKHSGLYITNFTQTYSEAGLAQSKLWQAGTLCITIAANIADTAILGIDACFPDSIIGFTPYPEKADIRFVKYLFDAQLKQKLQKFTQGAAQDNLSQEKLLSIKFLVPEIPEQNKIADIISAYDELIENNRRRIQLLERSLHLLYKEWFVHLRFPSHEHSKIVDGIPEGWEKRSLGDLAESVMYGYTASAQESGEAKLLRITDIAPDIINWDSVPFCEIDEQNLKKFALQEGDVVVARTGATVGYAKRIGSLEIPTVFASYLIRFRFTEKIDNYLAGIFIESNEYKSFVVNNAGGAAQPNANAKVLSSGTILVPTQNIQRLFRDYVEPICKQKDLLQKENRKLQQARDLLLPKLMSGAIGV